MKISRRNWLQAIVVTVGSLEACGGTDNDGPPGIAEDKSGKNFPQSIASGDPRPSSIVLWTRFFDEAAPDTDHTLTLEVGLDPLFTVMIGQKPGLVAAAAHDGNVKIKLTGLKPSTYYYYRFFYEKDGKRYLSRVGRTKTAPAATDTNSLKFAVATCQDFIGRYYNAWQYLYAQNLELDFIIFLGDYVYETTGDPGFQLPGDARKIVFRDPDSAISLGTASAPFYAAQSLSNYRDLYQQIRSDKFLQAVHEMFPFVCVWDDHEFSDDCHGATATYTDGKTDETNVSRRDNAELAFFEHMPIEHPNATLDVVDFDVIPTYPHSQIYRDLSMGKNLRLLVSDYRTYRPDHLVPEDAFPGTVVMDAAALAAAKLDSVFASDLFAYIDIDDPAYATPRFVMSAAYQQLATMAGLDAAEAAKRAAAVVKGPLALAYVNAVLTNPAVNQTPIDPTGKPRGIAWVHMGKRDLFSREGSRYVVVKDTFDAYAAYINGTTNGAAQNVYGDAQNAWLAEALAGPETWKVLVSSVSLTSLMIDLRDKTDVTDVLYRNRFYLNTDMWDGFPDRRRQLLDQLAKVEGGRAFAVSGDIHAAFASVESGVPCLTTPAISSQTVQGGAAGVAVGAGFDPTSAVYRYAVTEIETSFKAANAGITLADCASHGFLVVELSATEASATFYLVPGPAAETDYSSQPMKLQELFKQKKFKVTPGTITPA